MGHVNDIWKGRSSGTRKRSALRSVTLAGRHARERTGAAARIPPNVPIPVNYMRNPNDKTLDSATTCTPRAHVSRK
ncbi:unnamed protein product [Colias eurytheme]|nr:unnamed protein product [Colias eurytheme]